MRFWNSDPRTISVFLLCSVLSWASGCGKFFVEPAPPTPPGTGNFFYVANSVTNTIAGFVIGTSNITNTTNSPYSVGVSPSAIAVTPNSKYLYVASLSGAIFGYSIASSGALNLLNNGTPVITGVSPNVLRVDSSGQWLIAADLSPSAFVFSINATSGLLTQQGSALPLDAGSPNHILVTPNNTLTYTSLGTGGVDICTFNVSSGALSKTNQILKPLASVNADQGLASDPSSKYLFVTETGTSGVRVLSIASTGALTEVSGSPFKTGLGPNSVIVDVSGSYVYVTNQTDGTVSAFALATTGALTAISGSPFKTGTAPTDLTEDTSKTYLGVANQAGSPNFQVFTIGSSTSATPGGLTSFASTTGSATGAFAVVAAD